MRGCASPEEVWATEGTLSEGTVGLHNSSWLKKTMQRQARGQTRGSYPHTHVLPQFSALCTVHAISKYLDADVYFPTHSPTKTRLCLLGLLIETRAQFTAELSDSQSTRTSSFRGLDKTHTIQQDFPKIL